jgi:predicted metal-dependent hydrolase
VSKDYINNLYLKYRTRLLEKLKKINTPAAEDKIRLFGIEFSIVKNYSNLLKKPYFEMKRGVFVENLPDNCEKVVIDEYLKQWKVEKIRKILYYKTLYFNEKFGFKFNKIRNSIRIKEQRSLWGSCSHDNNLNFNCRVIEKRNDVIDYLVLHELNHTIHKNHSAKFWDSLRRVCRDCDRLKRELMG